MLLFIKSILFQPYVQLQVRKVTDVVSVKLKPPSKDSYKRTKIIDRIRIHVRGGTGGQGAQSTGVVGGDGGNVFIKCLKGGSLSVFANKEKRRIVAGHGLPAKGNQIKVQNGNDVFIIVPPGTEVKSGEGILISDLNEEGQVLQVVNGGAGGSAKYDNFNGQKGEKRNIVLELKSIADVALTGFPNAGKSSLLCALSRARPKVADYPFTTINPMVGSIFYSDNTQVSTLYFI